MDLASERDVMQFNEKIARHRGIKEGIEKGIKQMSSKLDQAEAEKEKALQEKEKIAEKNRELINTLRSLGMSEEEIQEKFGEE
jgi:chromosome segregation ATPase